MWIEIEGEHINLAVATSIMEVQDNTGRQGYKIFHGGWYTIIMVDQRTAPDDDVAFARWKELCIALSKVCQFLAQQEAK